MIRSDELVQGLVSYGRGVVQDFVAKSTNLSDVISYLQAERGLEMGHLVSHVTTNLFDFQPKNIIPPAVNVPQEPPPPVGLTNRSQDPYVFVYQLS